MTSPTLLVPLDGAALAPREFFAGLRAALAGGARAVTWYGQPAADPEQLTLTAVLEAEGRLVALRADVPRAPGFHSLTRSFPALHVFEREIFEAHGVKPHDHPWLKPVRFPRGAPAALLAYPFHRVVGRGAHEVAVGPVHAGVIEPGHFRFTCLGETVHHLEIQLGWQHRGVERLLAARDPRTATPLVETIAGDASVAHAWAHAAALEALAGLEPTPALEASRALGLELERIGMHLAGLAGLTGDVAFLQGTSTYGRLRTTVINATQRLCGNRFGRGWVRPGALRAPVDAAGAAALRESLALVERDVAIANDRLLASASVAHRLRGTGTVTRAQALELGLVGLAARASGVDLDVRTRLPGALHARLPVASVVEAAGDCEARARVRLREIDASVAWIRALLDLHPALERAAAPVGPLAPRALAVAVRESWRGEVVHALETDAAGRPCALRIQDPALRNWHGLALAVRGAAISDFPICNKSFDLSYCGSDL